MIANAMRKCSVRMMSVYAQRMKAAWIQDPQLVHQDWDRYFRSGADTQGAAPQASQELSL